MPAREDDERHGLGKGTALVEGVAPWLAKEDLSGVKVAPLKTDQNSAVTTDPLMAPPLEVAGLGWMGPNRGKRTGGRLTDG